MGSLCQGYYDYNNDDDLTYHGCTFIIKKNKYLLARYSHLFEIYNFEDMENINIKPIYRVSTMKNPELTPLFSRTLCDYDDDNFIITSSKSIYKYDEILNKIILVKKLEIGIEKIIDIKKIKNNKIIAHTNNELFIIDN